MPLKINPLPPSEYLHSKFEYDPDTGALRSKSRSRPGHVIHSRSRAGYLHVTIDGLNYGAHRVIWKMMTGRDPVAQIDHRDFDKANNRWCNLREASGSQNCHYRKIPRINKSGFRGVHLRPSGRYRAKIHDGGKQTYLGLFDTAEEAYAAYVEASKRLFGEFSYP